MPEGRRGVRQPRPQLAAHPALALLDRPLGENEWIPIPLEELLKQIEAAPPPPLPPRVSGTWMTVPLAAVLAGLAAGWQWFGFRMIAASAVDPLPATTTMLAVVALLAAAAGPWLPLWGLPRLVRWMERWRRDGAGREPACGHAGKRESGKVEESESGQASGGPDTPPKPPLTKGGKEEEPPLTKGGKAEEPPLTEGGKAEAPPLSKEGNPAESLHAVGGKGDRPSWLHRVVRERDEPLMWTAVACLASAAGGMAVLMLALAGPFTRFYQYLLEHFFWTDAGLAILEWTGAGLATAPLWLINGLVAVAIMLAAARRWALAQAGTAVVIGGTIGWAIADASHHQWTDSGLSAQQQILLGILPMFLLAGLGVLMSHDAAQSAADREDSQTDAPESEGDEGLIWLALLAWGIGSGLSASGWWAARELVGSWAAPPQTGNVSLYALLLAGGAFVGWLSVRHRVPSGPGCGMAAWIAGLGAGAAATLSSCGPNAAEALRAATLAVPAGYALAYAQTAWLARWGRRGLALAQMGTAILGGWAIGLCGGQWIGLPLLGPVGTMAAGGLALLAFGGLAQIFARAQSSSTLYLRLGLIFASLAGAITLFPSDVRGWNEGLFARVASADVEVEPAWLAGQALPGARRFCVIGAQCGGNDFTLTTLCYLSPPTPADAAFGSVRQVWANAWQVLRQGRGFYDVIYQCGPLAATGPQYPGYSVEWFKQLAGHEAAGGRVMVDVPLAGMNNMAAATVARTFQRAMSEPCLWCVTEMNGQSVMRLSNSAGPGGAAEGAGAQEWRPVEQLLAGTRGVSIHSLRRDAISRALRAGHVPGEPEVGKWEGEKVRK